MSFHVFTQHLIPAKSFPTDSASKWALPSISSQSSLSCKSFITNKASEIYLLSVNFHVLYHHWRQTKPFYATHHASKGCSQCSLLSSDGSRAQMVALYYSPSHQELSSDQQTVEHLSCYEQGITSYLDFDNFHSSQEGNVNPETLSFAGLWSFLPSLLTASRILAVSFSSASPIWLLFEQTWTLGYS